MNYVRSKSKSHGPASFKASTAVIEDPPVEIKSSTTTTFFPLLTAPSI
jgi:hypothetical protein